MDEFWVTESEAGSESGNDIGKKRKRKEKGKVRRRYAYTVIFKQPKEAKARVMTTEERIRARKFLNPEMESADIGVASFHDMIREAKERAKMVSKFSRKYPVKEKGRGRPAVRKKLRGEM